MNKKTAKKLRKFANGDPVLYEAMKRRWNGSSEPQRRAASAAIKQTIQKDAQIIGHK